MREPTSTLRAKKHTLLLVLDEFPQLGRMPTFETQMAAMAGYAWTGSPDLPGQPTAPPPPAN